ncbi:MAG TPA: DUF6259 domain-containing protein [Terracidiphilus sp.]|nr:DUF6259 domain-containing protein [Terracidiphilus sp.]
MDRRTFNKLVGLAAMTALTENMELSAEQAASVAGEVVLQDADLLVAFDAASGALVRMERKSTQWSIERRPAFGVSFRLHAPLPDRRDNFVLGKKQRAASVEKISRDQVRLQWKDLVSEHGGVLAMILTATVTLKDGALTFQSTLENNSPLSVETIDYPYFGDLNSPTRDTPMQAEHMWVGSLHGDEIYPRFGNAKGYWGVRYPTKTIDSNQSQFCLIQTPDQGIYLEMHDPAISYLLQFTFEQHPGVIESDNVPRQDEISGIPVHLEFRTCHFVFAHPHSKVKLVPVVMRTYTGDWHAGLDVYKQWRRTWFGKPHIAAWALDVNSWLQLRIDGAEQEYNIPYRELPQYIDECAANGVTAIQLVGWNHGGQDGGDPSLDTDPGMGTWAELHQAILHARSKGVNMILFGKPIFADMSTDYYKKELYKYEATDPYGNKYESGGYSYTTPTQLAAINNRRRAIMDVCSQAYRDVATREFQKTVALGAAGWLFDEVMQHNGVLYSFSPDHGYNPPGYLFSADIPLVKQFRAVADKVNPDFLFAGEGPGDWLMPYYTLGYYRIGPATRHALRYIDPQAPLMAAVTGFDDREKLNLILAYRYIVSYEPYNFKGHITDFPLTLAYGKKIDALRSRYKAWIWDADFRDTVGANVTADGSHRYTVFQAATGKRAVIVVNLESGKDLTATLDIPNVGSLMSASPEQLDAQPCSNILWVPARSAIVVMEQ